MPSEAAALTASSNSSSEAYSSSPTARAMTMRLRRVSSYCRTMRVPVFAVDFQWIWRCESPAT